MTEKAFLKGWAAFKAGAQNNEQTNPYFRVELGDRRRDENIGDWNAGYEAAREEANTSPEDRS